MNGLREYSRDMIEEIAKLVRDRLELSVPVDIKRVVKRLGGECVPVATTEYDVQIETINGEDSEFQFRINYAKDQIEERICFSIAHELGHLFLHMLQKDGELSQHTKGSSPFAEWEANEFAASILMPKEEFVSFCIREQDSENGININHVAEHFGVPKQAAYVRGNILNLWYE